MKAAAIAVALVLLVAQPPGPPTTAHTVAVADLDRDVRAFLSREMAAHLADIQQLNPPQTRVVGALTTGEYTWGTFMRALAAESQHANAPKMADRDVAPWIARMGLIEARAGSKAFSQLYSALALQHFGENLDRNAVWQALSPSERDEWRALLDVKRFYDPAKRQVINLPENYLGVAARVAAIPVCRDQQQRLGIRTGRNRASRHGVSHRSGHRRAHEAR